MLTQSCADAPDGVVGAEFLYRMMVFYTQTRGAVTRGIPYAYPVVQRTGLMHPAASSAPKTAPVLQIVMGY